MYNNIFQQRQCLEYDHLSRYTWRKMYWEQHAVHLKPPKELFKPLHVPNKILMGPGPSNSSKRVLHSLQHQILGHMHPEVFELLDEIKAGLQYAFQTRNKLTLALSTSGHGGMEACLGNLLEPGETVLIAKCGIWGERAEDMASRIGARVEILETELGVAFDLEQLEAALEKHRPAVVFATHAESSTGVKQPLEGVGQLVHRYNALLIIDAVASLGGEPFFMDSWNIDAAYTGSQKVLGAPAGLTPVSFSPEAERKIFQRKTKIPVYYWDMTILGKYWNCFGTERVYHHTISATLVYGLREALSQLAKEGLPASWARHADAAAKLRKGLRLRGLHLYVRNPEHQLATVVSVVLPPGVDGKAVLKGAMEKCRVEISGGLGPTVGKILRIGLLGINATPHHTELVLRALDEGFKYAMKSSL